MILGRIFEVFFRKAWVIEIMIRNQHILDARVIFLNNIHDQEYNVNFGELQLHAPQLKRFIIINLSSNRLFEFIIN